MNAEISIATGIYSTYLTLLPNNLFVLMKGSVDLRRLTTGLTAHQQEKQSLVHIMSQPISQKFPKTHD